MLPPCGYYAPVFGRRLQLSPNTFSQKCSSRPFERVPFTRTQLTPSCSAWREKQLWTLRFQTLPLNVFTGTVYSPVWPPTSERVGPVLGSRVIVRQSHTPCLCSSCVSRSDVQLKHPTHRLHTHSFLPLCSTLKVRRCSSRHSSSPPPEGAALARDFLCSVHAPSAT